jgi:hypothetical protein
MGNVLVLDGMTTPEALGAIAARLDATFAAHLVRQRAAMLHDGLSRDDIADLLERQAKFYFADRAQHLDELQAWLLRCDGRLH